MNRTSASLIAAGGVLLAAAAPAGAATLQITSGVPAFTSVDLGPPGLSAGDVNVFESALTPAGRLLGVQTVMGVGPKAQTVQGALSFDLPDGQIAVAGTSQLDRTTTGLLPGRPYTRAVVGGTGAYAGMRGTVTSTRRPDGTYDQAFALQAPATGGRTVTVIAQTPPAQTFDLAAPGATPGDLSIIDAGTLVDPEGAPAGVVRGLQQVVHTDTGSNVSEALLTYRLIGGDIVIGGLSSTTPDTTNLLTGPSFVRPILGGTGAYAGMTGTVTSTRGEDGRYTQRFDLRPGAAGATRTLRLVAPNTGTGTRADLAPAGVSAGDTTAYSGPLRDGQGRRRLGTARGLQTTIAVENGVQTVASQLTYVLRGRGELIVAGLSTFPATGTTGTLRNSTQARAVIGGTGEFAGAHGTLRASRARDGRYWLTFSLSGAPSRKR